jgi:cephalosporin hydroxylase
MKFSNKSDNPLTTYFYKNKGRLIHKWLHYFDIYHRHFAPYRKKPITIVEFGVYHGGSLQMWKHYFGKKARIYGIDINESCRNLEEKQVTIRIGDQANRKFLRELRKEIGPIDILIEDGGHTMEQQKVTFEEMFPAVKDGGIYLVEDLHTSYWKEYGGQYKKQDTFIEFAKGLIDDMHAYHSRDKKKHQITDYTKQIKGMHVYDSIIVFDKGNVEKPKAEKIGNETFPDTY